MQNNALICVPRIRVAPLSNSLNLSCNVALVHVMESRMRFYILLHSAKLWLIQVSTGFWRIKRSEHSHSLLNQFHHSLLSQIQLKKRWQTTRKKLYWTKLELQYWNNKLKLKLWRSNLEAILLLFWFDQIDSYFNQIIKIKPNI